MRFLSLLIVLSSLNAFALDIGIYNQGKPVNSRADGVNLVIDMIRSPEYVETAVCYEGLPDEALMEAEKKSEGLLSISLHDIYSERPTWDLEVKISTTEGFSVRGMIPLCIPN